MDLLSMQCNVINNLARGSSFQPTVEICLPFCMYTSASIALAIQMCTFAQQYFHPPRRDLLRHQPPVTSQPPNRPSSSQRYGSYQDRLYLINDPATYRLRLLGRPRRSAPGGKACHMLCEKPLTSNADEARLLVQLADEGVGAGRASHARAAPIREPARRPSHPEPHLHGHGAALGRVQHRATHRIWELPSIEVEIVYFYNALMPHLYHYIDVTDKTTGLAARSTRNSKAVVHDGGETWTTGGGGRGGGGGGGQGPSGARAVPLALPLEAFVDKVRKKKTPPCWIPGEESIAQMEAIDAIYRAAGFPINERDVQFHGCSS
ncbi:hypothetical protein T310_8540 [Rasamsonia emersonii CBS 393.64]|uniref:Uncharacterized protein n=1 Tax=Rasamsonia emersonii (strain ATCC 16479 / CBS 393.64 / IMI 116815) TaxID=1408163 RepID=A0A0F4YGZ1_RASE3|nr:hypothetical protein T310_8540 [Rasamsonia emersonii CBS 393.64]KKA17522.1 hypothetical protein T310_8540 [Rasamsonia emersonii CBS 393.64]